MDKQERGVWLNGKLSASGIPEYGRAALIARTLDCSNAVCQGWLQGSLPKDMKLALAFGREFSINLNEWVTGQIVQDEEKERFQEAIKIARRFERDMGELTDDQFIMVVQLIHESDYENTAQLEKTLSVVANIATAKSNGSGTGAA